MILNGCPNQELLNLKKNKKKGFNKNINKNINNSNKYGYLLEVDLDYPEDIHDFHNDYPLAPEKLKINKEEKLIDT